MLCYFSCFQSLTSKLLFQKKFIVWFKLVCRICNTFFRALADFDIFFNVGVFSVHFLGSVNFYSCKAGQFLMNEQRCSWINFKVVKNVHILLPESVCPPAITVQDIELSENSALFSQFKRSKYYPLLVIVWLAIVRFCLESWRVIYIYQEI